MTMMKRLEEDNGGLQRYWWQWTIQSAFSDEHGQEHPTNGMRNNMVPSQPHSLT
jgi:hypothetical protein